MPLTSPGNDDDTGENHQPTLRKNTAEPVEQTLKQNTPDPTGKGQVKWVARWKPALNAFAITFADRWPGDRNN